MRVSCGNIDPLTQITPLLWASSSPRTSTTRPSFIPTSTPHPVPQKRHTDLCQLCTGCRRATIPSRSPQPAAPAVTAPPSPPRVIRTSRRLISEVSGRSFIGADALFDYENLDRHSTTAVRVNCSVDLPKDSVKVGSTSREI